MPCRSREVSVPAQDHGGNLREVQAALGLAEALDFSASINPLGQPEGLRDAVFQAWEEVYRYPDRHCRAFRDAAAECCQVPPACVVAGNGSAELIGLLLTQQQPGRLLLAPPDFGLYEELAPEGLPIERIARRETDVFLPDVEALCRKLQSGDLVLLSNPGNPSGRYAPLEALQPLVQACADTHAHLVIDEAFADFQPEPTWLRHAPLHPYLTVLRSLTKFYAMPGLRLGFLVTAEDRAKALRRRQVPWSVNALAQEAGVYCMQQTQWPLRTIRTVEELRRELALGLSALPGVTPLPSDVNYLLLRLEAPAPTAQSLYLQLAARGIVVRHCGSFGLGERYVRVAVRTETENQRLLGALEEVILGTVSAGERK